MTRALTGLAALAALAACGPTGAPEINRAGDNISTDVETVDVPQTVTRLAPGTTPMAERVAGAKRAGQVLRYVAAIDVRAGKAKVGLESFAPKHAFASISLTDNIVQFETGRYCDNPLIIRGPGAGPAVTAGGIFADLLRLCSMLSGNHS